MTKIPQEFLDLLSDKSRAYLYLATTMPNGTPQITPVWFNYDGEYILVNTARGRVKDKNITARPQVATLIVDPTNPMRWIQVRGTVVEAIEDGAVEHIRDLAKKYRGKREFDPLDLTRVTYKIRLDHVTTFPLTPHYT